MFSLIGNLLDEIHDHPQFPKLMELVERAGQKSANVALSVLSNASTGLMGGATFLSRLGGSHKQPATRDETQVHIKTRTTMVMLYIDRMLAITDPMAIRQWTKGAALTANTIVDMALAWFAKTTQEGPLVPNTTLLGCPWDSCPRGNDAPGRSLHIDGIFPRLVDTLINMPPAEYARLCQQDSPCMAVPIQGQWSTCTRHHGIGAVVLTQCYIPDNDTCIQLANREHAIMLYDCRRSASIRMTMRGQVLCGPQLSTLPASQFCFAAPDDHPTKPSVATIKDPDACVQPICTSPVSHTTPIASNGHTTLKIKNKRTPPSRRSNARNRPIVPLPLPIDPDRVSTVYVPQHIFKRPSLATSSAPFDAMRQVIDSSIQLSSSGINLQSSFDGGGSGHSVITSASTSQHQQSSKGKQQQQSSIRIEYNPHVRVTSDTDPGEVIGDLYYYNNPQFSQSRVLTNTIHNDPQQFETLVKQIYGIPIDTTAFDLRNKITRTQRADLLIGDGTSMRGPVERSYPCVCGASRITHLWHGLQCDMLRYVQELVHKNHPPCFSSKDPAIAWSNQQYALQLGDLAVMLMSGTLPAVATRTPEFHALISTDENLTFARMCDRIRSALSVNDGLLFDATTANRFRSAGIDDALALTPSDSTNVISMWTKVVDAHRIVVSRADLQSLPCPTRHWRFARVANIGNAVDKLIALCRTGASARALDFISVCLHAGHSDVIASDQAPLPTKQMQHAWANDDNDDTKWDRAINCVVELEPGDAWPCDVIQTVSLAAAALESRLLSVGVADAYPESDGKYHSWITLPARMSSTVLKGQDTLVAATDGLVMGGMLSVIGGMLNPSPSHVTGCDVVAPFIFSILYAGGLAQEIDLNQDQLRAFTVAKEGGTDAVSTAYERAPSWDPLIVAAVGVFSGVLQSKLVRSSLPFLEPSEHPETLPRFADDGGAVSLLWARTRRGHMTQVFQMPQTLAMDIYSHIGPLAAHAFASLPPHSFMAGLLCLTRPMRQWVINGAELAALIDACVRLYGSGPKGWPNELAHQWLLDIRQTIDTTKTARFHITDLRKNDLANRVILNTAILHAILHVNTTNDVPIALAALCSLRLGSPAADILCPRTAVRRRGPTDEVINVHPDGGALPPQGVDLHALNAIPPFDEGVDAYGIPSQGILRSAIEQILKAQDSRLMSGINIFLNFLCDTTRCPTIEGITCQLQSSKCYHSIPLAFRTCNGTYVMSENFIPLADNPMSCAQPRVCTSCYSTNPLDPPRPYDSRALLPKNSPLMSLLSCYAQGINPYPHARIGYPGYASVTIKELFRTSPCGKSVHQAMLDSTKQSTTPGYTNVTPSFPDDVDEFATMMMQQTL